MPLEKNIQLTNGPFSPVAMPASVFSTAEEEAATITVSD